MDDVVYTTSHCLHGQYKAKTCLSYLISVSTIPGDTLSSAHCAHLHIIHTSSPWFPLRSPLTQVICRLSHCPQCGPHWQRSFYGIPTCTWVLIVHHPQAPLVIHTLFQWSLETGDDIRDHICHQHIVQIHVIPMVPDVVPIDRGHPQPVPIVPDWRLHMLSTCCPCCPQNWG